MKNNSVSEILDELTGKFRKIRTSNPKLEAESIIAHTLKLPRLEILLIKNRLFSKAELKNIYSLSDRRMKHEPLQYIFGEAFFRNLVLKVGKGVLIPRPETELLAGFACDLAPPNAELCDIGTGSGAISIAVGQERPDMKVTAVDISPIALKYARKNCRLNKIANVRFIKGSLLSDLKGKKFDIITANLPYVSEKEFKVLPIEIRKFEPENALLSGKDGLRDIRRLIRSAHKNMKPHAFLILEISPSQKTGIGKIFHSVNKYEDIRFMKDLNGLTRFCIIQA